jgi:DnaK suppressor protein
MTTDNLEKCRTLLLAQRDDLLSTREVRDESSDTVHLDQQSVGRLSRMDALQSQALAQAGKVRADRQLRLIAAALLRIDNDEYGNCRECGEPVNPKRLEADPTSLYCIGCAQLAL